MNQKNSSNWNIAATHFLTAGFVMPFLVKLVAMVIFSMLFASLSFNLMYVIQLMIIILSVWLGVIYSAKYITKKYIIKNPNSIVSLSTIYLIVLHAILRIIEMSQGGNTNIILGIILSLTLVLSFYFFSKKYVLPNTTTTVA